MTPRRICPNHSYSYLTNGQYTMVRSRMLITILAGVKIRLSIFVATASCSQHWPEGLAQYSRSEVDTREGLINL